MYSYHALQTYEHMAFTNVVSKRSVCHTPDLWTGGRLMDILALFLCLITVWHFYVDFNESPAGESFSLPAPSITTSQSYNELSTDVVFLEAGPGGGWGRGPEQLAAALPCARQQAAGSRQQSLSPPCRRSQFLLNHGGDNPHYELWKYKRRQKTFQESPFTKWELYASLVTINNYCIFFTIQKWTKLSSNLMKWYWELFHFTFSLFYLFQPPHLSLDGVQSLHTEVAKSKAVSA